MSGENVRLEIFSEVQNLLSTNLILVHSVKFVLVLNSINGISLSDCFLGSTPETQAMQCHLTPRLNK